MGVKLSQLKANKLRKEIKFYDEDNKIQTINIYNPLGNDREEILKKLEEISNNGELDNVSLLDVYVYLIKSLTDIEIDDETAIYEILSSPNGTLILVQHEINEILNEMQVEYWMLKHAELNQTYQLLITQQALNKSEHIETLARELDK